jgi:hypothetical protein
VNAAAPDSSGWLHDLSITLNKIGAAQRAENDGAAALESFRKGLSPSSAQPISTSTTPSLQRGLADH